MPVVAVCVLRKRARSTCRCLRSSPPAHTPHHKGKQLAQSSLSGGQRTISSTMGPFFSEKSLANAVAFFTASTSMPSTLRGTRNPYLQIEVMPITLLFVCDQITQHLIAKLTLSFILPNVLLPPNRLNQCTFTSASARSHALRPFLILQQINA